MTKATIPPQAGFIEVKKCNIVSHETGSVVDIKGNYISIDIRESIYQPFIDGYIDIVDTYGMIYPTASERTDDKLFHIRGEEYLHIEYYDYESLDDATKLKKETYFIYAIEEISQLDKDKETGLQYRLFFTSPQKIFSDTKVINKAYRNQTISEMVETIYDEYYKKPVEEHCPNKDKDNNNLSFTKPIIVEPTTSKFTICVPSLSPERAIQFLGRRAYSEKNHGSFFMFFETRENFYFCTQEYLTNLNRLKSIEPVYQFEYSHGKDDNSPEGQDRAQQIISNATFPSMNSVEAIKAQAYSSRVSEVDLLNRNISHYYYHYKDNYLGYDNIDERPQLQNSKTFIEQTTGDVEHISESYVFKDYAGIGEPYEQKVNYDRQYPYYKETMSTKPVFDYHMKKAMMTGNIKGRNTLIPGDIIDVLIPEYTVTSMKKHVAGDQYFGGPQMVTGIDHRIVDNVWNCKIAYSKNTRGGGLEKNKPGTSSPPSLDSRVTNEDLTLAPDQDITSETSTGNES